MRLKLPSFASVVQFSINSDVLHQLGLVHLAPLHGETENARGKLTFPKLQRLDSDKSAVFVVAHVKVRRIVIVEVHRDHDAEEAGDFWHGGMLQAMNRERSIAQSRSCHIDQMTMMRKDHDLSALGESRERTQYVRRAFIVRGDEYVVEHKRHVRV